MDLIAREDAIKTMILEKLHLRVSRKLSRRYHLQNLRVNSYVDACTDAIVYEVEYSIFCETKEETLNEASYKEIPADWFQAFKLRFFPQCMFVWFPVRYTKIEVSRKIINRTVILHPEIDYDVPEDKLIIYKVDKERR